MTVLTVNPFLLSTVFLSIALGSSSAIAQGQSDAETLEPVACMTVDGESIDSLYQSMKDVVLSIQVCVSDEDYTRAAELYFITWPYLAFNQEAQRNDYITRSYVSALDATLQHYFDGMTEAQQTQLGDHFDAIVTDAEYRQELCSLLRQSQAPVADIRQEEQHKTPLGDAETIWQNTVTGYGCPP